MATGKITKRAVDELAVAPSNTFLWDNEVKGFGIKCTPTGAKSYLYQYRMGGRGTKVQRVTIGKHGTWTPDAARKEAKRLDQLVDQGIDPSAAKRELVREKVELAFPSYAERFIEEYLKVEWKGSHEIAAGILRRDAVPTLKHRSVGEITRADITSLMDKLVDRPATRRNAFAVLRRLLRWAVNRGDIPDSPARDMDPPPAPLSRDRVLNKTELVRVWNAAETLKYPFGPLVQMLMLTGQRREEVAGLSWDELSRTEAVWTLPQERAKNGTVHRVPLSASVVKLLDQVAAQQTLESKVDANWPLNGFVFTANGEKHVTGYSIAKMRLDRIIEGGTANKPATNKANPIHPWRFHDLRRTLATGLQELGVRFEVTEAVLNHRSGSRSGVAGIYQRYDWDVEKREALDAWDGHITALLTKPLT